MSSCFPMYAMCNCIMKIYKNEGSRLSCASINCDLPNMAQTASMCCGDINDRVYLDNIFSSYGHNGLRYALVALAGEGLIFCVFIFMREYQTISFLRNCFSKLLRLCSRSKR